MFLGGLLLVALALVPVHKTPESLLLRLTEPHTTKVAGNTPAPLYQASDTPVKNVGAPAAPALSATNWYAVDVATGQPFGGKDADIKRPIASITKLATALTIIRTHDENEIITIPQLPAYQTDDEVLGVKAGERFTVKDLLAALMIHSANDAADSLALADSGSREAFAANMNQLMGEWNIDNASFSNPSGLTDAGNGASAKALVAIASLALRNPTLKQLMNSQGMTISDQTGKPYVLKPTNTLLPGDVFSGIKTGYTGAAGQCFIGLATIQGHQIITVVLGSQDRFGESQRLADWINTSYTWHASP